MVDLFSREMRRFSARTVQAFQAASLPVGLSIRAAAADTPAEILLYDEIGFYGITARDFVSALASAGAGPVRVRINSPGGDVFDGLAIYNALRAHPGGATAVVDGLAASAASFIALAGSRMEMAESSMLMIHDAWGVAIGNKNDMRTTADLLDKVDGQLAEIYAAKTGKPVAEIAAAMDAETWYTAQEAVTARYCDGITAAPDKGGPAAKASALKLLDLRARIALAEAV
jgi:ATP-dependent Clp endopeptidase proteolytic subunit ClpP